MTRKRTPEVKKTVEGEDTAPDITSRITVLRQKLKDKEQEEKDASILNYDMLLERMEGLSKLTEVMAKQLETLEKSKSNMEDEIISLRKKHDALQSETEALKSAIEKIDIPDVLLDPESDISDEKTTFRTKFHDTLHSMNEQIQELKRFSVLSSDDFSYFWFEDQHRGPADRVRESLHPFLRYFQRCQRVADLGCGRGEFLDLCAENGIGCYGIDSNEDMVLHCRRLGHEVIHADVIEYIAGLGDKSLDGILCSQVIEHLSMHSMVKLFREGFRALKRGTRFVVVTINPRSLFALANNFYLDPTHVRPIPPETIRFLLEDVGFRKIEIDYYSPFSGEYALMPIKESDNEMSEASRINFERLNHVVFGFQEYAVVGTK